MTTGPFFSISTAACLFVLPFFFLLFSLKVTLHSLIKKKKN